MPWMLFDCPESDEVQNRGCGRIDAIVELPAFLVNQSCRLDEFGSAIEVLLEKHRRFDAARIALEYGRTILEERHDVVSDLQIETEKVKLREFFIGPIDSVQTGYRDLLASHLYD